MKGRRIVFGPADLSNVVETAGMTSEARYLALRDELVARLEDLMGSLLYQDHIADLLEATIEASFDAGADQVYLP